MSQRHGHQFLNANFLKITFVNRYYIGRPLIMKNGFLWAGLTTPKGKLKTKSERRRRRPSTTFLLDFVAASFSSSLLSKNDLTEVEQCPVTGWLDRAQCDKISLFNVNLANFSIQLKAREVLFLDSFLLKLSVFVCSFHLSVPGLVVRPRYIGW